VGVCGAVSTAVPRRRSAAGVLSACRLQRLTVSGTDGCQWRYLPHDLPLWPVVYRQTQRWIESHCFETMVEDLVPVAARVHRTQGAADSDAAESRTIQSTPESGARAGYDGAKRRKGSKVHAAVDTLGHLLALRVTPADEQDRAQVGELASQVQLISGGHVELAYVDQGYTGQATEEAAAEHGIRLDVVEHTEAKEASCCCPDDGSSNEASLGPPVFVASHETTNGSQPPGTFHFLVFACLMVAHLIKLLHQSS
jgi:transposase